MRHHDAHEADEAAHAHHRCGAHRCGHHHGQAYARNIGAERGGFLVAHAQHIEVATVQQQHHTAGQHVGQHQGDITPAGRGEAAEDPAVHLTDHIVIALQHECLHGRGQ